MRPAWFTVRKILFWCHLAVGLTVSAWVLFMASTGTMIAYQAEIVSLAERQYRALQPKQAECYAASPALKNAEEKAGRGATALVIFRDSHQPMEVQFGRSDVWLMDPCSGGVLLAHSPVRAFFRSVVELHYAATFRGRPHPWLRQLKAAADLGFLFLLLSGVLLWLPRNWRVKNVRAVLFLRRGATGRARAWNLHHVFGIWLVFPLLLISTTGAVLAYPWVRGLLYRASGEAAPAVKKAEATLQRRPSPVLITKMDRLVQRTGQAVPQWKRMEITLPLQDEASFAVVVDTGEVGRPQQRVRLPINPTASGTSTKIIGFRSEPRGRQWTLYARYLHTGEMFGLFGKSIAFLASCGVCVLVWTGLALSWRRWTLSIRRIG